MFVGFGETYTGMSKFLQNNKAPKSPGRVELLGSFVACTYTSMEVTVLSCRFS